MKTKTASRFPNTPVDAFFEEFDRIKEGAYSDDLEAFNDLKAIVFMFEERGLMLRPLQPGETSFSDSSDNNSFANDTAEQAAALQAACEAFWIGQIGIKND